MSLSHSSFQALSDLCIWFFLPWPHRDHRQCLRLLTKTNISTKTLENPPFQQFHKPATLTLEYRQRFIHTYTQSCLEQLRKQQTQMFCKLCIINNNLWQWSPAIPVFHYLLPSFLCCVLSLSQAQSHGSKSTEVINASRSALLSLGVREGVSAMTATTWSLSCSTSA